MIKWCAVVVMMLGFVLSGFGQQIDTRNVVRGSSPGYYYVDSDNVIQDSQSAAIGLTIPNFPRNYIAGVQVVFETEVVNGNQDNITLKVNRLSTEKLLTRDGEEFGIGELDSGVLITATYDGNNFKADFNPRPQFRYIEPTELMLNGNAYSIMDTSIPPVATASILLGIKAKATNTGNVTVSVNGSQDYALYLSNGDQIPSGALLEGEFIFCIFTTTGGIGFRAINLRPARSLKGRLLASVDIPAGMYTYPANNSFFGPWVLTPGETGISVVDYPVHAPYRVTTAITDGLITLPVQRIDDTQLGWYIEVVNGTNVVYTRSIDFGEASFGIETVNTDGANVVFGMWLLRGGFITGIDTFSLAFNAFADFTLDATDDYSINFYISEN